MMQDGELAPELVCLGVGDGSGHVAYVELCICDTQQGSTVQAGIQGMDIGVLLASHAVAQLPPNHAEHIGLALPHQFVCHDDLCTNLGRGQVNRGRADFLFVHDVLPVHQVVYGHLPHLWYSDLLLSLVQYHVLNERHGGSVMLLGVPHRCDDDSLCILQITRRCCLWHFLPS